MHPSSLVALVDDLEGRGLVARLDNAQDRRTYALHLTGKGRALLGEVARVSREHNEALCAGLSVSERETLAGLLQRIAEGQGLQAHVHPGYARMPGRPRRGGRRSSGLPGGRVRE